MERKFLFYGMKGELMCFLHLLMNALDLDSKGYEVKVIFEGQSVKLPAEFEKEGNPLYKKALEKNLIAGVCKACAVALGVYEEVENLELPMLDDMNGHAGMEAFIKKGYEVISM